MNKLVAIEDAVAHIKDGATIMVGGFLSVGTPEGLIDAICEKGVKDLTLIGNDTAFPDRGVGKLIVNRQVSRVLTSHIGTNPETKRQMSVGEIEYELIPQGTLAERIRAAGAGLGGVLTPVGIGTLAAQGKQKIEIEGKECLIELPLHADIALIKASKADKSGNLVYRKSARNFNPLMATAATVVIAEIDEILEVGEIDPDEVITPKIFVDFLVASKRSRTKEDR
ncbi:acetate CoA-transferase subunit alpha [candidate division WOR-3 bacterium]|nr:acetate CoA-transferase subunit alpha [candidate division WOR-3 bacterium]